MENDKDVVAGSIEERDEEFAKDPACEQERGERCKRKKKVMKGEHKQARRSRPSVEGTKGTRYDP